MIAAFGDLVGLSRQEVAVGLMRRFGLEEAAQARMAEFGVGKPWQAYVQIRLGIYEEMLGDPKERRSLDTEMRFENKVVVITGGGGGIGKAAAGAFSKRVLRASCWAAVGSRSWRRQRGD